MRTMCRTISLALTAGVLAISAPLGAAAEATPPDRAAAILEQFRAANQARGDQAREEAAWVLERQRLEAVLAATRAETARLERDAGEAERARDTARTRLSALGAGSDLDALRARLREAGARLIAGLGALAATTPPGVVPRLPETGDDSTFDAAVRALEAAERAAGTIAVEVITGTRDGRPEAVKALRVAGAAAWWVSLDGSAAGTLRVTDGAVLLSAEPDAARRMAIIAALAQADGRDQPAVAVLPAPAAASGVTP